MDLSAVQTWIDQNRTLLDIEAARRNTSVEAFVVYMLGDGLTSYIDEDDGSVEQEFPTADLTERTVIIYSWQSLDDLIEDMLAEGWAFAEKEDRPDQDVVAVKFKRAARNA